METNQGTRNSIRVPIYAISANRNQNGALMPQGRRTIKEREAAKIPAIYMHTLRHNGVLRTPTVNDFLRYQFHHPTVFHRPRYFRFLFTEKIFDFNPRRRVNRSELRVWNPRCIVFSLRYIIIWHILYRYGVARTKP